MMKRSGALALVAATSFLAAAAVPASAQEVVRLKGAGAAIILQGVKVPPGYETFYLSGQLPNPVDPAKAGQPNLTIADYGDTKTQTMSTLAKIKGILESQGYTMSDVIKLTVFLAGDPKLEGKMDFAGMNEAFRTFFGSTDNPNTVARSTVQVAALAGPAFLVEIEATAVKPPK